MKLITHVIIIYATSLLSSYTFLFHTNMKTKPKFSSGCMKMWIQNPKMIKPCRIIYKVYVQSSKLWRFNTLKAQAKTQIAPKSNLSIAANINCIRHETNITGLLIHNSRGVRSHVRVDGWVHLGSGTKYIGCQSDLTFIIASFRIELRN